MPNALKKAAAARQKNANPYSLGKALKNGGPIVWLSCLVMGLANIFAGQYIKGLLFLAIEVAFIAFLLIEEGGIFWLSMLPSLGDNWAATVPPCITINGEQKQLLSFGGSKAIAVNPNAEHPQAAAALAAFLASPEAQLSHFEFNGTAPVSTSLMSENEEIASNPSFKAAVDTVMQGVVDGSLDVFAY